MTERRLTKKDCGVYLCTKGYRSKAGSTFKADRYYHLTDVQQNGTLLMMSDRKGDPCKWPIGPQFLREHFTKITVWSGPDDMQLQISGDPREYQKTYIRLIDASGYIVAEWAQTWPEFDDDGRKMTMWPSPMSADFIADIEDAGSIELPPDVHLLQDFRHHKMTAGEWPRTPCEE